MARYHFTRSDGTVYVDPEGQELADLDAARTMAVDYLGDMMRGRAGAVWADGSMTVTVSNDRGLNLLMATVVVTNSPAAENG